MSLPKKLVLMPSGAANVGLKRVSGTGSRVPSRANKKINGVPWAEKFSGWVGLKNGTAAVAAVLRAAAWAKVVAAPCPCACGSVPLPALFQRMNVGAGPLTRRKAIENDDVPNEPSLRKLTNSKAWSVVALSSLNWSRTLAPVSSRMGTYRSVGTWKVVAGLPYSSEARWDMHHIWMG